MTGSAGELGAHPGLSSKVFGGWAGEVLGLQKYFCVFLNRFLGFVCCFSRVLYHIFNKCSAQGLVRCRSFPLLLQVIKLATSLNLGKSFQIFMDSWELVVACTQIGHFTRKLGF